MNEDKYLQPKEIYRLFGITPKTLFIWSQEGKIKCVKTKGGHRRYLLSEFETEKPEQNQTTEKPRRKICYCRVSTNKQKEDLLTQKKYFSEHYRDYEVISDIGSGLNFKRKGFKTILDEAIRGNISEIVVSHRDRLCRFGFDLIEGIVSTYSSGKIVVLNQRETSPDEELVGDLISIITVFSSRIHGLRSHALKRQLKRECACKNIENTNFSDGESEDKIGSDV